MPIPTGYTIPNQVGQHSTAKATEKFGTRGSNGERVITSTAADDAVYSLAASINIPFYGVNQSIYVNSNSYITFGTSSNAYKDFSLNSTKGLYIKALDGSIRYLSEKSFSNLYHVVRYEGQYSSLSSSTNVPNIWEVTFFIDGVIELNHISTYVTSLSNFSGITNGNTTTGNTLSITPGNSYVFIPKENPTNGYYFGEGSYNIVQTFSPPQPIIVSNSKVKLSRNIDHRQSNLVFKFDKEVTQWTVNVGGTSPTTGYIADSGGTVNANTNITAIVDDMELQSEGQNKVNIYGKGEDGLWTPYEA